MQIQSDRPRNICQDTKYADQYPSIIPQHSRTFDTHFVDKMTNLATATEPHMNKAMALKLDSLEDDGFRLGTTPA